MKTSSAGPEYVASNEPLWKRVKWMEVIIIGYTPLVWLYGIMYVPLQTKTLIAAVVYYYLTGLAITAGYHRLWSHRAYQAKLPYRLFWAILSAGAMQWDIYWWCLRHRAHHRWTDTDDDPYSAKKGLFFSHIGWLIFKNNIKALKKIDMSDLLADPVVVWQRKYYKVLATIMGFIFPTLVAGIGWGDWIGGYVYVACARLVVVQQSTFCVNSLAHYLGEAKFDDKRTPRDHFFTALATMGEGYHNFHHEFPQDYRNAIKYYQYDPTKWIIKVLSFFGVTYDLKTFPSNEIQKGVLHMKEKVITEQKKALNWGRPLEDLPRWTRDEFYDVENFLDDHPGGRGFLKSNFGRDASKSFNGAVYDHSNAARNLMAQFRVAVMNSGDDSGIGIPTKKDD
ncbi:fatty acid desaturase-domain-containing protein [Paraphysoderma sedebokerense]|nr:fatty acid desaturase-domain-containing protein [Paraphysoderma sedebokerense]